MQWSPRRTKIVCTIGPASADAPTIDRLLAAGMNVARLNMSHGDRAAHAHVLARLRRAAAQRDVPLAVLLDLQGPKVRTGPLAGGRPVELRAGETVEITTRPVAGTAERISTSYAALPAEARVGARVLLTDGLIELRVEAVGDDWVRCRVVHGGTLRERQGLTLPGLGAAAPALTDKDLDDLAWGVAQDVDYIGVSFVRRPEDMAAARAAVARAGGRIPLIAKLEKPQALDHLDAILAVSDGVMVARGDLGVELPPEEVPAWQKRIIAAAARRLVPVITATQMLESMVRNPLPTRAEVTDVANAIWDGTDAVMLSAETAVGEFPAAAVAMMDRIARAAERESAYQRPPADLSAQRDLPHAIGLAARAVSGAVAEVAAIVAFTRDGATARLIAKDRPRDPVLALTDDEAVYRRLALFWGVQPVRSAPARDLPALLRAAEQAAREAGLVRPGAVLTIIGHLPPEAPGSTNFLTLHPVTS
jgi:pyruvate kinase